MHSPARAVNALENVPTGHGNNVIALGEGLSFILVNPDARRANIRIVLSSPSRPMASFGELIGFLGDKKYYFKI